MKASTGYCVLSHYGAKIGDVLGFDGMNFNPTRVAHFEHIVRARIKNLASGQLDADDIRVFVKQEPHSGKKIKQKRFRLISAVSMVDSMIDRMLFGNLADEVLRAAGKTPVMIGWVPILGGYRTLRSMVEGRVLCIDKSSWDWTVPYWMTQCWLDIILGLCNSSPSFWELLVRKRFELLFDKAVFQFEDGVRVRQEIPGIMKSGCFLTIILNSVGQLLLHYLIADDMGFGPRDYEPRCMGDDTVQQLMPNHERYIGRIGELGFLVKEAKIQDWIEFAGFMIDDKTWPVYWQKHLYKLQTLNEEELPEVLEAYQIYYAQEPVMLDFIHNIMGKICPKKIVPGSILNGLVTGNCITSGLWRRFNMDE